jgi:repressor LexA
LGELDPHTLFAFAVPDNGLSGRNVIEGDIVIAERRGHARDGDCVVVTIRGRETLLRRIFRDASRVELRPANDDFPKISLPADGVQIEGIYRALIRPAA